MKWLAMVILAGFTSGCMVIVPTPHCYVFGSRKNVSQETFRTIQPKVDTMEDVVLRFGEPDSITDDGYNMEYSTKKILAIFCVYFAEGNLWSKCRDYKLSFDTNSVVSRRFDCSENCVDY